MKEGKSLDILLKKVKHQMVEKMSSSTADALGLSRAILCNGKKLMAGKETLINVWMIPRMLHGTSFLWHPRTDN